MDINHRTGGAFESCSFFVELGVALMGGNPTMTLKMFRFERYNLHTRNQPKNQHQKHQSSPATSNPTNIETAIKR